MLAHSYTLNVVYLHGDTQKILYRNFRLLSDKRNLAVTDAFSPPTYIYIKYNKVQACFVLETFHSKFIYRKNNATLFRIYKQFRRLCEYRLFVTSCDRKQEATGNMLRSSGCYELHNVR